MTFSVPQATYHTALGERTKQRAVREDTGNSFLRKSNFPELVERRRHRTGDCGRQGGRGRPEEVISQINHSLVLLRRGRHRTRDCEECLEERDNDNATTTRNTRTVPMVRIPFNVFSTAPHPSRQREITVRRTRLKIPTAIRERT